MLRWSYLLVALTLVCATASAQAGNIFSRTKKNPAEQVEDLTKTLQTDADERHRKAAAEELAKVDGRAFPAAVTTLIESTLKDPSDNVRIEAAQALGRIRPISAQTAYALEYALANDPSTRVRSAAKSALWQYHVAGYRGNPTAPQTAEPGLAPAQRPSAPTARPTALPTRPAVNPAPSTPVATTLPTRPVTSPVQSTPPAIIPPPVIRPTPNPIGLLPSIELPAASPAPAKSVKSDDGGPVLNPPM
jgi:hypothetical protein